MLRVNFDKRNNIRLPSFNRSRMKLRAPINSEAMNLEDHQLSYEIYNISAKQDALRTRMVEDYTVLETDIENVKTYLTNLGRRLKYLNEWIA